MSAPTVGSALAALATLISLIAGIVTLLESDYTTDLTGAQSRLCGRPSTSSPNDSATDPFEEFWEPIVADGEFVVVLPHHDIEYLRDDKKELDHQGAHELLTEIDSEFDDVEFSFVSSGNFGPSYHSNHIISIAGPAPNDVTYELLYRPGVHYNFERTKTDTVTGTLASTGIGDPSLRLDPETVYDAVSDERRVEFDYGLVTRMPNPYDDEYVVVNVAGGFGEGTWGGTQLLRRRDALEFLIQQECEFFQAVYATSVDRTGEPKSTHFLDCHPDSARRRETFVELSM